MHPVGHLPPIEHELGFRQYTLHRSDSKRSDKDRGESVSSVAIKAASDSIVTIK